jgi:hypothetical protein
MTKIKICSLNLVKLLSMPNIFVQSDFGTTVDQQTAKHTFQVIIKCTIISNLLPPFLEQNKKQQVPSFQKICFSLCTPLNTEIVVKPKPDI